MISAIFSPAPAGQSADGELAPDAVFSPIEMKVLTLAAHTVVEGRPCAVGARFLRRFRSTVLGERPPTPLTDPRLETLRRLACKAFLSGGHVGPKEAEVARAADISQAQIDDITRIRTFGRHRARRGILSRRRRAA